jgi:hypothetical protein
VLITINWPEWLNKLRRYQDEVSEILDEFLGLKPLVEKGERQALANFLQRYEDPVIFLEEENRKICAYRWNGDYVLRQCPPEHSEEKLQSFISYTLKLGELLQTEKDEVKVGMYYSLDPLVYSGDYWLNTVCRRELARVKSAEPEEEEISKTGEEEIVDEDQPVFSVLLFPLQHSDSIETLGSELRSADSLAYFGSHLGVVLPFTPLDEARNLCRRLKDKFYLSSFKLWQYPTDFKNYYELKTSIEKRL